MEKISVIEMELELDLGNDGLIITIARGLTHGK